MCNQTMKQFTVTHNIQVYTLLGAVALKWVKCHFFWRKVIVRVSLIACQKIMSLQARELPQKGGGGGMHVL